MKLLLSAIVFVASATERTFAQSDDRCLCESADNANCPANADEMLMVLIKGVNQTVCFGGYPGGCKSFFDAITCYWNTGNSNNDAYIGNAVSCNDGCSPFPALDSWMTPPDAPIVEPTGAPVAVESQDLPTTVAPTGDVPKSTPASGASSLQVLTTLLAAGGILAIAGLA
eukprot:CAMPEP_0170788120 /NCGR_PEP_ID=MMETSP0733-20121128/18729_1 /TAXON_ID=186038 /ORGANISM="Fragilariopsis kerguelensis, Strain L26-C5" /LENGTH=169 /DNA_ID=CAMNT_0011134537 /DNA_START=131 /DNA_END=640 /DNA_ORIENTATION=+